MSRQYLCSRNRSKVVAFHLKLEMLLGHYGKIGAFKNVLLGQENTSSMTLQDSGYSYPNISSSFGLLIEPIVTLTPLIVYVSRIIFRAIRMFCDPVLRRLALRRQHSLLESSHTVCSTSEGNDRNERSGFIASKMWLQSYSSLLYQSMISYSLKMRLSTVCRKLWLCLTPYAIHDGLFIHQSFSS